MYFVQIRPVFADSVTYGDHVTSTLFFKVRFMVGRRVVNKEYA